MADIIQQGFGDLEYVLQEKVHGANLSFITDGQNIVSANRTEIMSDVEEFFNSKLVRDKYKGKILTLYQV